MLRKLLDDQRAHFKADVEAAKKLLAVGDAKVDRGDRPGRGRRVGHRRQRAPQYRRDDPSVITSAMRSASLTDSSNGPRSHERTSSPITSTDLARRAFLGAGLMGLGSIALSDLMARRAAGGEATAIQAGTRRLPGASS